MLHYFVVFFAPRHNYKANVWLRSRLLNPWFKAKLSSAGISVLCIFPTPLRVFFKNTCEFIITVWHQLDIIRKGNKIHIFMAAFGVSARFPRASRSFK